MKNQSAVLSLLFLLLPIGSTFAKSKEMLNVIMTREHKVSISRSSAPQVRFSTRKDTIVFYPENFCLEPDAQLNDFFQHIPGIYLDAGQLYWHEKELTVHVDYRKVFGGWGITGVIPVSQIKEVLIFNSTSDLTDASRHDDQEEDYILNIVLLPERKDKWNARLDAGYQTPGRFEVSADAVHLNNRNPFIAFFNANTINQNSSPEYFFNDKEEIGQYGRQQYGALSFQHHWNAERRGKPLSNRYYINTEAGHSDNWGLSNIYREMFLLDGSKNYDLTESNHYVHNFSPTWSGEIKWKLDQVSSFKLVGELGYTRTETTNTIREAQLTIAPFKVSSHPLRAAFGTDADSLFHHQLLNRNYSNDHTWGDETNVFMKAQWERLIGTSSYLEVSSSFQYADRMQKYNSDYHIDHFQHTYTDVAQKYNENPSHRWTGDFDMFYKQWLTDHLMFSLNYNFSKIHLYEKQKHYHSPVPNLEHWELLQHLDQTNTFEHEYNNTSHLLKGAFVYRLGPFCIQPSLAWTDADESAHHHRVVIDTLVQRHKPIWNPALQIEWKISPLMQTQAEYNYSTYRPDLLNIIPWVDNTHPIYQLEGNKNLHACNMHSGRLYFLGTFPQRQAIFNTWIKFRYISSPITRAFAYDKETNTYTTRPQNAMRATYHIEYHADYQQYFSNHWNFKTTLHYFMENRDGFLTAPSFERIFKSNRQHIAETTLSPQVTYEEHPHFKCALYGNLIFTRNQYRGYSNKFNHLRQYDYGVKVEKYMGPFLLRSDLHDLVYKGYVNQRINGHHILWAASATWFCLKGKGQLQLSCDDLLNNTLLYHRLIEPHTHTEIYENRQHHYLNISFTYDLHP